MTCGQAAQYQFRTARVTVVSPARAGEASAPSARGHRDECVGHGPVFHDLRISGARRSKAIAPATRTVAKTRLALTIWFGSGRPQAAPSAHAALPGW